MCICSSWLMRTLLLRGFQRLHTWHPTRKRPDGAREDCHRTLIIGQTQWCTRLTTDKTFSHMLGKPLNNSHHHLLHEKGCYGKIVPCTKAHSWNYVNAIKPLKLSQGIITQTIKKSSNESLFVNVYVVCKILHVMDATCLIYLSISQYDFAGCFQSVSFLSKACDVVWH